MGATAVNRRAPAAFDVLRTNTASGSRSTTLGGGLSVFLIHGFAVTAGDRIAVMEFDSRSGDFAANEGLDLGGGLVLQKQLSGAGLALEALQTLAAAGAPVRCNPRDVDKGFGSDDWEKDL